MNIECPFNEANVRLLLDSLGLRNHKRMSPEQTIYLDYIHWCVAQLQQRLVGTSKLIITALLVGRSYSDIAASIHYSEKWLKAYVRGFLTSQMITMYSHSSKTGFDLRYETYITVHYVDLSRSLLNVE